MTREASDCNFTSIMFRAITLTSQTYLI